MDDERPRTALRLATLVTGPHRFAALRGEQGGAALVRAYLDRGVGARDLRANPINPGPTATAVVDRIPKPVVDHIVSRVPAGRMGRPAEIASAVLFLASDESSVVRGTELFVDGGFAQVRARGRVRRR